MDILQLNVDSDRRVESGYASATFDEFKFSARAPRIFSQILDANATVVALQELDNSSVIQCTEFLIANGYEIKTTRYNADVDSFHHLIAYRPSLLAHISSDTLYFNAHKTKPLDRSEEKDIAENSIEGETFEKSMFVCRFKTSSGKDIYIGTTHFGLRTPYKVRCAHMISEYISTLDGPFILCGDFNTFPSDTEAVLSGIAMTRAELTDTYVTPCPKSTFIFHKPYDFGVGLISSEETKRLIQTIQSDEPRDSKIAQIRHTLEKANVPQLGGTLDHIFYKGEGIKHVSSKIINTDKYMNIWDSIEERKPLMPSDHFPIHSTFQL